VAQGVPGRLRHRIFLTFRHYFGGRSSVKRTGRLYPRRNPWCSLSETESTSGHMVLSGVPRKKSPVTPPGIYPGTVRPVTQLIFEYFSKIFNSHQIRTRITGSLHEDQYTFFIVSRSVLLRMRNVSDKSCRENQNTQFLFNTFFFRKSCRL